MRGTLTRSSATGTGRRNPSPPAPLDFSTLLGGLEQAICTRLELIESSLQRIQLELGIDARGDQEEEEKQVLAKAEAREGQPRSDAWLQAQEDVVAREEAEAVFIEAPPEEAGEERESSEEEEVGHRRSIRVMPDAHRHLVELGLGDLDLRPEWLKMADEQPAEVVAVQAINQRWSAMSKSEVSGNEPSSLNGQPIPWWVIQPSGRFRTCWDIAMLLIITHDMAVIPVTIAFQTGESIVSTVMFWPFLFFWTFDIPITFLTGFYRNGLIEVRLRWIALHYLCTWLLLDCFMVFFSWLEVFDSTGSDSDSHLLGRMGKNFRVFRVMRSIRILRLAKLRKIADQLGDYITSEYNHVLFGVFKLIITIIWLNHFIACSWWAIGVNVSDGGRHTSWTSFYQYENSPLSLKYFTSLHWSLTQFTPASMDVSARNTPERIFSVIVLLFALIAFSSFISSITAHMTHLRQLQDCHSADFARLRRYLRAHQVPIDLGARIIYCVEYRIRRKAQKVQDSDVSFLQLLSKPLQRELAYHMFSPILDWHPFFARCSEVDSEAVRRICAEAISSVHLAIGDLLFAEGEGCSQMFFLTAGRLRYTLAQRDYHKREKTQHTGESETGLRRLACRNFRARSSEMLEESLEEHEWCCEISIWCMWTHLGSMIASNMSEVVAVNSASVIRVASSFHFVARLAARYADLFMESILESLVEGILITDMSALPASMIEDIVARAQMKPGGITARSSRSSRASNDNDAEESRSI